MRLVSLYQNCTLYKFMKMFTVLVSSFDRDTNLMVWKLDKL